MGYSFRKTRPWFSIATLFIVTSSAILTRGSFAVLDTPVKMIMSIAALVLILVDTSATISAAQRRPNSSTRRKGITGHLELGTWIGSAL
jgi:predicted RND superfamily exporter protein